MLTYGVGNDLEMEEGDEKEKEKEEKETIQLEEGQV